MCECAMMLVDEIHERFCMHNVCEVQHAYVCILFFIYAGVSLRSGSKRETDEMCDTMKPTKRHKTKHPNEKFTTC